MRSARLVHSAQCPALGGAPRTKILFPKEKVNKYIKQLYISGLEEAASTSEIRESSNIQKILKLLITKSRENKMVTKTTSCITATINCQTPNLLEPTFSFFFYKLYTILKMRPSAE